MSRDDDSESPPAPPLPRDAAAWRAHFASLPSRDLMRVVQADKAAAARVFSGFRLSAEKLRHPVVLQRLVDEALKQPEFAKAVGEIAIATAAETRAPARTSEVASPDRTAPDLRLKEKLKEQRTALLEKESRLKEMEAALAASEKARDGAQAQADAARTAQRAAEEETGRQRRQREREEQRRRAAEEEAARAAKPARAKASPPPHDTAPTATADPPEIQTPLLEDALTRLLARRKFAVVAEVCREALAVGEGTDTDRRRRGFVHGLYAAALYGQNDTAGGETQDRLAATALMDAGDFEAAAEAMARRLTRAGSAPSPTGDAPIFRRLFTVAERMGQTDGVRAVFSHLRIAAPDAYQRLRASLRGSGKIGAFLDEATHPAPGARLIGPDEVITLPGNMTATPRGAVEAVDRGEEDHVGRLRGGLRALRRQKGLDARLAGEFLEAVSRLDPIAAVPLLQESGSPIIVDASNVARHDPDPLAMTPQSRVANLRTMRDFLLGRGFFPVVMLADANLRYHVDDRAAYLALIRRGVVRETPPGTSADEALISEARHRPAPLVSNDRLAEWGDAAFEIERYGFTLLSNGVVLTPF